MAADRAAQLKRDAYALYLACRDPRVPWYAKALAACAVGYLFSPIDLIPDFIPVLGWLDDLLLVPLAVMAVRGMIPDDVLRDCRARADAAMQGTKPVSRLAAAVIIALWLATGVAVVWWLLGGARQRFFSSTGGSPPC